MTDQEIKNLKDGVPNYRFVEVLSGPAPEHKYLCGECTGSGVMLGYYPCKVCGGTGYDVAAPSIIKLRRRSIELEKRGIYPNVRERNLLKNRIARLKTELQLELQKSKATRNQREVKSLQQSINTLTKWIKDEKTF